MSSVQRQKAYLLPSSDCELLLAFEQAASLPALAKSLRKDASALSRQLQKIASLAPVLEKTAGRWRITDLGRELNRWTMESVMQQRSLLNGQQSLKVGATRTFSACALVQRIPELKEKWGNECAVSLVTVTGGIEKSLLAGEIDIGFSCGKPWDPAVACKRGPIESYVAAASPSFCKKHKLVQKQGLVLAPHLMFSTTNSPDPFREYTGPTENIYAVYNDVLCAIEAARMGLGWGVFPLYAIAEDLKRGRLQQIPGISIDNQIYGVWWLRERKSLAPYVEDCMDLFKSMQLN